MLFPGRSPEQIIPLHRRLQFVPDPPAPSIIGGGLIPEGMLLLGLNRDLELLEMGDQLLPLRIVPEPDLGWCLALAADP